METLTLDIEIRGKHGDAWNPIVVQIYRKAGAVGKEGTHYLGPDCVSFEEVEGQVKRLKKELDHILQHAKKKCSL